MATTLRHRCRNPRCRMKLKVPVENEHHAFCCRGCFDGFYRSRCRVCEKPLRDKRGGRLYCRPPNKCAAEAQKWPHVYAFGLSPQKTESDSKSGHSTGLPGGLAGDRPRHKALRGWSWHSDDLEHELRDADGTLLARLESNAGRHRLTHPRTTPILSWADLAEAKHRAESIPLGALPLDPKTAARVAKDNSRHCRPLRAFVLPPYPRSIPFVSRRGHNKGNNRPNSTGMGTDTGRSRQVSQSWDRANLRMPPISRIKTLII
jgi:hypothetical protein